MMLELSFSDIHTCSIGDRSGDLTGQSNMSVEADQSRLKPLAIKCRERKRMNVTERINDGTSTSAAGVVEFMHVDVKIASILTPDCVGIDCVRCRRLMLMSHKTVHYPASCSASSICPASKLLQQRLISESTGPFPRRKLATIKFTNKLRSYGLNHISRRVFDIGSILQGSKDLRLSNMIVKSEKNSI
ncbi:hypothetical protein TNCV_111361 [Trichonephila clavipes]|nr:hypothetical protein TNCV_111361 [Trichonephila clavipes]